MDWQMVFSVLFVAAIITFGFMNLHALLTHDPDETQEPVSTGFRQWEDHR